MNLPINRHKCLIAMANDIIADGVDIDVEDIERINKAMPETKEN